MIEEVERLDLERRVGLAEVDVLAQAEVRVPVPGPVQDANAGIAERARGGVRPAADVEPYIVRARRVRVALAQAIRPLVRTGGLERLAGAVIDGQGQARACLEDRIHG